MTGKEARCETWYVLFYKSVNWEKKICSKNIKYYSQFWIFKWLKALGFLQRKNEILFALK